MLFLLCFSVVYTNVKYVGSNLPYYINKQIEGKTIVKYIHLDKIPKEVLENTEFIQLQNIDLNTHPDFNNMDSVSKMWLSFCFKLSNKKNTYVTNGGLEQLTENSTDDD
jgi:hypothetical protein